MLTVRLLGDMEVCRGDGRLSLPPSKKTRALLAYLAVTGRTHRRERLCELLWEVPDDPRGALRWSLTKLRPLLDEPDRPRVIADRESVSLDCTEALVDLLAVRRAVAKGVERASVPELKALVREFRGEFLEGLALPEQHRFHAWCVAEREEARRLQISLLQALITRLSEQQPEEVLPFARDLVQVEPFDEAARATLLRLLVTSGRRREAEEEYEAGRRLIDEAGTARGELYRTWRELSQVPPLPVAAIAAAASPTTACSEDFPRDLQAEEAPPFPMLADPPPLLGREVEWRRLLMVLENAARGARERAILLLGEPGIGKSRLLAELIAAVQAQGGTVLDGSSYEVERHRPFGPWIDALQRLPSIAIGERLSAELSVLLPELSAPAAALNEVGASERGRDRLFAAVAEVISLQATVAAPVLLALDDAHWCDAASVGLLHYVLRMNRHRPVIALLAARGGELQDNRPVSDLLRHLRRDRALAEIPLAPLKPADTERLIAAVATGATPDAAWVHAESGGNPLFAIELARAAQRTPRGRDEDAAPAPTLKRLVRDRIETLPREASDILRWAAVLGPAIRVDLMCRLVPLDEDVLIRALETLEGAALIRSRVDERQASAGYRFAHDLVRRAVYTELSEPRRRLMHRRIAEALSENAGDADVVALDVARHAARAGEAAMAAHACVAAARRCVRLFANDEAERWIERGLHYAEGLSETERVKLTLELMQIGWITHRPKRPDEAAEVIKGLAERALDLGCIEHARLGFHILAYSRWEVGEWSEAWREVMRAAQISRAAPDDKERLLAAAEAARCLVLLERDLPQAEALILEASALSSRAGTESSALCDADGMLRWHRGESEAAARQFERAREIARRDGDRLGEFEAIEHLLMLSLEDGRYGEACLLGKEIDAIGKRLRGGSEASFARAVCALADYAASNPGANAMLAAALEELRVADAKHRLALILNRAAELDLARGSPQAARARAAEALRMAEALERPSELVLARAILSRAAAALGDGTERRRRMRELRRSDLRLLSAYARRAAETSLRGENAWCQKSSWSVASPSR
jgi:DNA-binding SARP family transcriptional activator